MESPFQVCVFITAVPITSPFQVVLDVHESPSLSVWDPKIFAQGRSHPTFLSVSASHGACRHMLEPVRPEAVLSDMSLCLPTFFSHFWIVNKTSLSLSIPPSLVHVCVCVCNECMCVTMCVCLNILLCVLAVCVCCVCVCVCVCVRVCV